MAITKHDMPGSAGSVLTLQKSHSPGLQMNSISCVLWPSRMSMLLQAPTPLHSIEFTSSECPPY